MVVVAKNGPGKMLDPYTKKGSKNAKHGGKTPDTTQRYDRCTRGQIVFPPKTQMGTDNERMTWIIPH